MRMAQSLRKDQEAHEKLNFGYLDLFDEKVDADRKA